jgi:hypothetical protein
MVSKEYVKLYLVLAFEEYLPHIKGVPLLECIQVDSAHADDHHRNGMLIHAPLPKKLIEFVLKRAGKLAWLIVEEAVKGAPS